MLSSLVNPHGLCLPGLLKAHLFIESYCIFVSSKHLHMEIFVDTSQPLHDHLTNALTSVFRMNQQVGEINHQVAIADGIAQPQ